MFLQLPLLQGDHEINQRAGGRFATHNKCPNQRDSNKNRFDLLVR
jgi:hypothetical protein